MNNYCFLDVELKLRSDSAAIVTPAYFQGSIESSLTEFFGEIGGQTDLELVKFDTEQRRGILKVPEAFSSQARAAITLIGYFQDIPCHFKTFGKDTVIFATKEDHAIPPNIELPPPEPSQGLITKDGEINWSCPCLGGMATGPCGVEFREAFSCFHNSEAEPKGSDCYEAFRTMQDCFTQYPTVYNKSGSSGEDDDDGGMDLAGLTEDVKEDEKSAIEASLSKTVEKQ